MWLSREINRWTNWWARKWLSQSLKDHVTACLRDWVSERPGRALVVHKIMTKRDRHDKFQTCSHWQQRTLKFMMSTNMDGSLQSKFFHSYSAESLAFARHTSWPVEPKFILWHSNMLLRCRLSVQTAFLPRLSCVQCHVTWWRHFLSPLLLRNFGLVGPVKQILSWRGPGACVNVVCVSLCCAVGRVWFCIDMYDVTATTPSSYDKLHISIMCAMNK